MKSYEGGKNNLDFLRVLLASLVVILHLSILTGNQDIANISSLFEFASTRAVPGFFIVSGFLIYMSYERASNLTQYYWHRFLRLYPAYIFLLICCASLLYFASNLDASDYFGIDLIQYLVNNLFFLNFIHPNLPGVFQNNSVNVVNGALWTLKIEVLFYISIPLIHLIIKRLGSFKIILFIYISSTAYSVIFEYLYETQNLPIYRTLSNQLPGQMSYFISGITAYLYHDFIKKHSLPLLCSALLIFTLGLTYLEPLALMFILIYAFTILKFSINMRKVGDISYGVYIYHFPIIQVFVHLSIFQKHPLSLIALTYLTTFILAYSSWVFIEKRALALKKLDVTKFSLLKLFTNT
jgi:peptidoglycan/LPS O-acetylase OafA/YrhL